MFEMIFFVENDFFVDMCILKLNTIYINYISTNQINLKYKIFPSLPDMAAP